MSEATKCAAAGLSPAITACQTSHNVVPDVQTWSLLPSANALREVALASSLNPSLWGQSHAADVPEPSFPWEQFWESQDGKITHGKTTPKWSRKGRPKSQKIIKNRKKRLPKGHLDSGPQKTLKI